MSHTMDDQEYKQIFDEMTWSYSRISSFLRCPYSFFLRYFCDLEGQSMFFASYGSFMHKILDSYYKNELKVQELPLYYLTNFTKYVAKSAPSQKMFADYFKNGLTYFENFHPLPFTLIDTEIKVEFKISNYSFVGFIDYLGTDGDNLVLVDHKSRALKPRSTRSKPTKTDALLDEYLIQLYLYSIAVEKQYGATPKWLCFNCFRTGTLIKELFDINAYQKAQEWAVKSIQAITSTKKFCPNIGWFQCSFLCDYANQCEYFQMFRR